MPAKNTVFAPAVLDSLSALVVVLDARGHMVYVNRSLADMTGYAPQELEGQPYRELLPAEDAPQIHRILDALSETGGSERTEGRILCRDGSERLVEWTMTLLPEGGTGSPLVVGTGTDVTLQTALRRTLEENEARFSVALESSGDGIWDWDIASDTVLLLGPLGRALLGSEEETITISASAWLRRIHPEDALRAREAVRRHLDGETDVYGAEFRVTSQSGAIRWLRDRGRVAVRNASGAPLRVIGTAVDITERKEAELALLRSEQRYHTLYDAVSGGVVVQNNEGVIVEANATACDILGYDRETMLGTTFASSIWETVHEDGSPFPPGEHPAMQVLGTGKPVRGVIMGVRHPGTGDFRWLVINAQPVPSTEGDRIEAAMATFVDITAQKLLEERLDALSAVDDLTKLYNRRGFFRAAEQLFELAGRQKRPLFLALVDVDGMKHINDTRGHQAGDEALVVTAELLRKTFRKADLIARFGGDEFIVLGMETGTPLEDASERLANNLAAHNAPLSPERHLSLSMGITSCREEPLCSIDRLITEADARMYAEKDAKRRRRR